MARGSLAMWKKRLGEVKEATADSRVAKRKRQQDRKKKESASKTPDFQLEPSDCGQTPEKVLSYIQVQDWLREGITKRISWSITLQANHKWWGPKQRQLARHLLEAYDGELIKKAIFYLCDNWEDMVRDRYMGFSGKPTIEILWSFRESLFPDAERDKPYVSPPKRAAYRPNRPDRDAGEYKEPKRGSRGHGW